MKTKLGPFKFRYYDWSFPDVYHHSCIIGGLPNEELYEVCDIIKRDKKYVWIANEFRRWFKELGRKEHEIKKAKRFEDFEGRRKLRKFSELERAAAGLSEVWTFRHWYVNRLKKEGYLKKSKSSEKEEEEIFKKAVREFADGLKAAGFRLVKKHIERC